MEKVKQRLEALEGKTGGIKKEPAADLSKLTDAELNELEPIAIKFEAGQKLTEQEEKRVAEIMSKTEASQL